MELTEDDEKFCGTVKVHQDFLSPSQLTVSKALVKSIKAAYRLMFCSAFLLYVPYHKDHVCCPSVGPAPTLTFWHVFLGYHQDEPIQQDASQGFACNRW